MYFSFFLANTPFNVTKQVDKNDLVTDVVPEIFIALLFFLQLLLDKEIYHTVPLSFQF